MRSCDSWKKTLRRGQGRKISSEGGNDLNGEISYKRWRYWMYVAQTNSNNFIWSLPWKKYAKEPISLAVDSLAILNQKNSIRQIDRNCHLELLILRRLRLATWSCLLLVMFCQFQTFLSMHAGAVAAPSRQWVETWLMEILSIPLVIIFETITQWFFSTLPAFRGLCLQACYHLITPNCRWLVVILNWFFILYPKIAAIMKKIFLAFFTHPMLIANFFPFVFCPVELKRPLYPIEYITSPLHSPLTDDCMLLIFTWGALDTIRGITDHQQK